MTTYWPEGVPTTLKYPDVTVGELFTAVARHFDTKVAIEDGDEELTFVGLLTDASRIAHALRAEGIGRGDSVLLHLPNSRWFVVCYFAAQLAGATVSPANPLYPVAGLAHQLAETGAVAAFSHPDHADVLLRAREGTPLRRIVVVPGTAAAPASAPVPSDPEVVEVEPWSAFRPTTPPNPLGDGEAVAHLAFTGGTTGVSKGVRVLQRNVVANVCQALAWRAGMLVRVRDGVLELPSVGRDDVGLREGQGMSIIAGPMYHAHALVSTLFMLTSGARIVILGRFSPERMLQLIEERRAGYITGSPTMWHSLLACPDSRARDLTSLQVISSGAAPIDGETMGALQEIFPSAIFSEGYGLTEATCIVTSSPGYSQARRKLGSVGQPLPDTEVEIRDPAGRPLPPGEKGELWVRGPQVTGGYLGHPELTAEQHVDGWLRTGDVAYFDDEGFLFIADRAKDMLIYKGYNVYPRELEEVLVRHPDVDRAAVVGRRDRAVGEVPVAFVVPVPGADPDTEELMSYVAGKVLPYQKIRAVHLVEDLPTNAAGKVLKNDLRGRLVETVG